MGDTGDGPIPPLADALRLTLPVGLPVGLHVGQGHAVAQGVNRAFCFLGFDALTSGALLIPGRPPLPGLPNS